jgi:hypothetical protein
MVKAQVCPASAEYLADTSAVTEPVSVSAVAGEWVLQLGNW